MTERVQLYRVISAYHKQGDSDEKGARSLRMRRPAFIRQREEAQAQNISPDADFATLHLADIEEARAAKQTREDALAWENLATLLNRVNAWIASGHNIKRAADKLGISASTLSADLDVAQEICLPPSGVSGSYPYNKYRPRNTKRTSRRKANPHYSRTPRKTLRGSNTTFITPQQIAARQSADTTAPPESTPEIPDLEQAQSLLDHFCLCAGDIERTLRAYDDESEPWIKKQFRLAIEYDLAPSESTRNSIHPLRNAACAETLLTYHERIAKFAGVEPHPNHLEIVAARQKAQIWQLAKSG